jgi:hypothetical protein
MSINAECNPIIQNINGKTAIDIFKNNSNDKLAKKCEEWFEEESIEKKRRITMTICFLIFVY